jgi:hypothetical protein
MFHILWYLSSQLTTAFWININYACSLVDWETQSILGLLMPCLESRDGSAMQMRFEKKKAKNFCFSSAMQILIPFSHRISHFLAFLHFFFADFAHFSRTFFQ